MSPSAARPRRLFGLTVLAGVLWIGLLFGVSPWDVLLSQALAAPSSLLSVGIARWGEWPSWALVGASLLVLAVGRPGRWRTPARASLLLVALHPLLLTQSLKQLWGRVRPRDLSPDLLDYTPFFQPAGPGSGESFPSGHAAMAASLLPLALWLWRRGGAARVSSAALLLWVLLVALGRVVARAHYPTDVIFSLGVAALLSPWLLRLAGPHPSRGAP